MRTAVRELAVLKTRVAAAQRASLLVASSAPALVPVVDEGAASDG